MAVAKRPLLVALRPLGLGDLLTGIPALRALRATFAEHRLVLAAPAVLRPLALLSGAVDDVVHTRPLQPLPHALRGADLAVDLHGRGPRSHRVLLASQPRRLIAFANPAVPKSRGMASWRAEEHEVNRWCRLLAEAGIRADPDDLDLPSPPRAHASAGLGATLVHPGAASAARRWPADRFAAVARAEADAGRRVLVTGSAREAALAHAVAEEAGLPPEAVLAGRTDLLGLATLVAAAGCLVSGDTGVAHLATAFRTPSVVLLGPTPPTWWGPPPERHWHCAIWAGLRGDPHAAEPHPGLLRIGVADVLAELAGLERKTLAA